MKSPIFGSIALTLFITTLTTAAAVLPHPSEHLSKRQELSHSVEEIADDLKSMNKDPNGYDTPQCLWQATGPGGVGAINFYLEIPNWQATFDQGTAVSDLKGSLGKNHACASGEKVFFSWNIIGNAPPGGPGTNTTLAATVYTSVFCTAYQMTKVIHATTGLPGIACEHADTSENHGGEKPDTMDPVDGSDGFEDPEPDPGAKFRRSESSVDPGHTVWIIGSPDSSAASPSPVPSSS